MTKVIREGEGKHMDDFQVIPLSKEVALSEQTAEYHGDVEIQRPLETDQTYQRALGRATAKQDIRQNPIPDDGYEYERQDYLKNLPFTD